MDEAWKVRCSECGAEVPEKQVYPYPGHKYGCAQRRQLLYEASLAIRKDLDAEEKDER